MNCVCGQPSKVTDSRMEDKYVRRRRKCLGCGKRWTTYEIAADDLERVFEENRLIKKLRATILEHDNAG